jgi:hypothetical protein
MAIDAYFGSIDHHCYVGGANWQHGVARRLSMEFRKLEWEFKAHPKSNKCFSKGKHYGLSQIWDKWIKIK